MLDSFIENAQAYIHTNPWLAILTVFLGCIVTASNPCVLAMVPLMMSFVAGRKDGTTSTLRAFGLVSTPCAAPILSAAIRPPPWDTNACRSGADRSSSLPMAAVAFITPSQRAVVADSAAERELLASADDRGRIVLHAAYYAVSGETILLPEGTSELGADAVRRAFEAAAKHHETARSQRGSFHIVNE